MHYNRPVTENKQTKGNVPNQNNKQIKYQNPKTKQNSTYTPCRSFQHQASTNSKPTIATKTANHPHHVLNFSVDLSPIKLSTVCMHVYMWGYMQVYMWICLNWDCTSAKATRDPLLVCRKTSTSNNITAIRNQSHQRIAKYMTKKQQASISNYASFS